jgi:DNA-binding LytR/AlgR family response regulator
MKKRIKHKARKVNPAKKGTYFFIRGDKGLNKIFFKDVLYCEASRQYSDIHLKNHQVIKTVPFNLADFQRTLPADIFFRIHKHFLVNIDHIVNFRTKQVVMDDESLLSVAKNKLKPLLSMLPILRHGRGK